ESIDPRGELVRQLLEYKRFKDASIEMTRDASEQARRWPRGAREDVPQTAGDVDLDDVQVWDLMAAFNKLLSATGRGAVTHDVIVDDTPVALHAADIIDLLARHGGMTFCAIFAGRTPAEMIGLFLALLELMRQSRIKALQPEPFGEIEITLLSTESVRIDESTFSYAPPPPDDEAADDVESAEQASQALVEAAEAGESDATQRQDKSS
ncbi:MAG: segregation/condensation protein A, partial [Phycisphaerae bacterium]